MYNNDAMGRILGQLREIKSSIRLYITPWLAEKSAIVVFLQRRNQMIMGKISRHSSDQGSSKVSN